MGGEGESGTGQLEELQQENERLHLVLEETMIQLTQLKEEKTQIQKCYDKAIQEVADSEAKREVVDKELRFAHDQIGCMWKELENLKKRLENPPPVLTTEQPSCTSVVNDSSLSLLCTLCQQKMNSSPNHSPERHDSFSDQVFKPPQQSPHGSPIPQRSRKGSWFFGRNKSKVQDMDAHSLSGSRTNPNSSNITVKKSNSMSSSIGRIRYRLTSSPNRLLNREVEMFLLVNVTRNSNGTTDMAPFKIVTKTNLSTFPASSMEVYRSQGDFQWLYSALQEVCPERIVPPLRPPISLDATISEFQRFLSRVSTHKTLSKHPFFIIFLSGTAKDLRTLRAKHHPTQVTEKIKYKPAMGRDTNSGPLVETKDYLTMLEQNLTGLSSHLEQSARKGHGSPIERAAHWFRAISDSEPHHTYLKKASTDLARTCEGINGQLGDSDEMLFIQNLRSLTDYIRVAQGLLTRVEDAVDQYLYWDEEVTLIEAVNSSPVIEDPPTLLESGDTQDVVFDDSGVSDVTSNSTSSTGEGHSHSDDNHVTKGVGSHDLSENGSNTSERWAHASKQCADAKDHLEMMCHDLAEEISFFDLQKEKEIKQIFLDYASSQLEKHEKFQGKWFAMKFLLDSPVTMEKRAIQFNHSPAPPISPSANQSTTAIDESREQIIIN